MTDKRFVAAGDAIGPDDLHIPAQPRELRQALEQINELADQLDGVRAALDKAAGDEDVHGETAFALQRVVRFSRFTARRDAGLLRELAESLQQEIKVLHDVQGDEMQRLRARWEQARHELVAAAKDADGPGAQQLARRLGADLTEPYVPLFRRLTGHAPEPTGGGAAHAMLADSALAEAMQDYRRTVHQVLEEFEGAVRSVRNVEEDVRANLHWEKRQKADDEQGEQGESQADKDPAGISGPRVLRRMLEALDEGSGALDNLVPALQAIDKAITAGMLPDHDDQRPPVFQNEWEGHFQRRVRRMRLVSKTADKMANELRRLDADTAAQIFKDSDEPAKDK